MKAGEGSEVNPEPICCEFVLDPSEFVVPYSNQYVVGKPFGTICPLTKALELEVETSGLVSTVGLPKVSGGVFEAGGVVVLPVGGVVELGF